MRLFHTGAMFAADLLPNSSGALPHFFVAGILHGVATGIVSSPWTAKDMRRMLETLAGQYQGKFALALSDVARDQQLAQSLRVQGLPSIRVIQDGQLIDQLDCDSARGQRGRDEFV